MANPYGWVFLRQHGDMFFGHVFGDSTYQVQVTHECLTDSLGSDGSREGDENAIVQNMESIQAIAQKKIEAGAQSPIQIGNDDF
ncbi:hypothetical protein [Burkholderia sp. LA-2-3-30-S1-D2]|uniref:hypothetical protein n=1 Tax=Burkholderia sp. LA-2-3-30-S1-D2 TaxID=1637862 RepID=UPI0007583CA3|nr:hypothetical protein [Burkholderia sp. LA-2-3-30-S1-D2]AOI98145.1 hypothetical protein WS66_21070 [Burkholderia sp. LA-2-3-30-S1-D2]KVE15012.1 hypothetical protein WS66_10935 [Burkholderia sp. LA-2-3-30-S1-D2]